MKKSLKPVLDSPPLDLQVAVNVPRISPPTRAAKARLLVPALALLCAAGQALAQPAGTPDPLDQAPIEEVPVISQADITDPMLFQGRALVCGDIATAGTPIAGNAAGGGNSGEIAISTIPVTASVINARLYWTVLTDSDQVAETGKTISFDGNVISGEMVGFAEATPCFPQQNTVAWKADVTGLLTNPGNGVYAVAGFPGDNTLQDGDFTEGVSLVITYSDSASTAKTIVNYEGLAVTTLIGETLHQTLAGFEAGSTASASWIPIVGNGQVAGDFDELIQFSGGAGALNFDASLDGGTTAFAPLTCSYLDVPENTNCYWDDDVHDVSGAINPGDIFADVNYELANDCHSFVAMDLAVSVDDAGVCSIAGAQVDALCPPTDIWSNHGEYVSCVAHAAEEALAGLTCVSEEQLDDIHGCIVSERAKSDVGKPQK